MKLDINLKRLMESERISLTDLAKATGVPKQTIHNWLCGAEPKRLDHVRSVAKHFRQSIEELCYSEAHRHSATQPMKVNPIEEFEEEIRAGVFEVVLRRVKR